MIVGIVVQNYKCYKGIQFIPFMRNKPEFLRVIIGNNGVGKSAILEALDSFFNNTSWTIHSDATRKDASIGVFFLQEKSKTETIVGNERNIEIISKISEAFWDVSISANSAYSRSYSDFFLLREKISHLRETHYLFMIGCESEKRDISFLTFHGVVNESLKLIANKPNLVSLNALKDKFLEHYSYLYIPVETSISDFLKLEAKGMQVLMDKNIKDNITSRLNDKKITRTISDSRQKKLSILDMINESLEKYINSVETEIQKIDNEYNFKTSRKQSRNLTANHITDVIVEAYYAKRNLKKGEKVIATLSSGEKRRALIDIAYVFLSQSKSKNNDKELILAIDEPESSLHISKCYEQFDRIQELSTKYNHMVFIATHWYGALPIISSGSLLHIEEKHNSISLFDFKNYFEERREHPDDIHFKSFFDLATSILSSLRSAEYHWLIVEGLEDKLYIEYYLDVNSLKLNILPLGGCGNVIKLYEYLFAPLSHKKQEETDGSKKKVLCLIDTDDLVQNIDVSSETKNKLLAIRRLNPDQEHKEKATLLTIENPNRTATEIEDVLEGEKFYKALKNCIENTEDVDLKDAFNSFDFDPNVPNSRIKGDESILNHKGAGRVLRADKQKLIDFIDQNKGLIAQEYITQPNDKLVMPQWISLINDFFIK